MEEKEYKSTYSRLTEIRCVFEKALTNHRAVCHLSNHFCLADREGYACLKEESANRCREILENIRKKSLFALKLHNSDSPLPHNMEIRVQVGGLTGLVKSSLSGKSASEAVASEKEMPEKNDIDHSISAAIEHFGSIDHLPYSEIMQSVVQFKGRRKRQRS